MKNSAFLVALSLAALWPLGTPLPSSAQEVSAQCEPSRPTDGRASPYASASASLEGGEAVICYGRPSAREREIFGGLVPLDRFWRTGADEPTTLHVAFPADVGGIAVDPGSYSLYTRPGAEEWQVYLNTAIDRWGIPINDEVRASEVGEATVAVEALDEHVEMFTIRFEEVDASSAHMIMEWERTRVRVPISVRN